MSISKIFIIGFLLVLNSLFITHGSSDNHFSEDASNSTNQNSSEIESLTRSNSSHSNTSSVEWLSTVEKHWDRLVDELEKRKSDCPQSSKKSRVTGIPTTERILTSLTNLLNYMCTCTAAIIGPDQRLWIAYNADKSLTKKKLSTVFGRIQALLKSESVVLLNRKSMIKNEDVLKILEMCTDVGRSKKDFVTKAFGKAADKLITNIKKLLQLKTYSGKNKKLLQLKKALSEAKISYYSGGQLRKNEKYKTEKFCVHAEMNFLQALTEAQKPKAFNSYLAISRLCCRKCAAAIEAFNRSQKKAIFTAPGCHGNDYQWPIPVFIKKKACLKEFIGSTAYSKYEKQKKETKARFMEKLSGSIKSGKCDTRVPITTTESEHKLIASIYSSSNGSSVIKHRNKYLKLTISPRHQKGIVGKRKKC